MLRVMPMLRVVIRMVRVLYVGGVPLCGAAGVDDSEGGGSRCGRSLGLVWRVLLLFVVEGPVGGAAGVCSPVLASVVTPTVRVP